MKSNPKDQTENAVYPKLKISQLETLNAPWRPHHMHTGMGSSSEMIDCKKKETACEVKNLSWQSRSCLENQFEQFERITFQQSQTYTTETKA